MEPGGSMPHSQGLSNNSYPEPNQPNYLQLIPISSRSILILSFHLCLGLPKGLFPVGLPVKILKALLPFSILATCPAYLNLLDLINTQDLSKQQRNHQCRHPSKLQSTVAKQNNIWSNKQ